jgi:hypothetical protein
MMGRNGSSKRKLKTPLFMLKAVQKTVTLLAASVNQGVHPPKLAGKKLAPR